MSAEQVFQRRDEVEELIRAELDAVAPDADSRAYLDAVRRAAEAIVRHVMDSTPPRFQHVAGGHPVDHADALMRSMRGPTFSERERARARASRTAQDTIMLDVIAPIVAANYSGPFREDVLLAVEGKGLTLMIEDVSQLDESPIPRAWITFRLSTWANGQSYVVQVAGADATNALNAWQAEP